MTGIGTCLGFMGGLNQDQVDPPAAPANAPSAFNGELRAKAPLGFDSTPSHRYPTWKLLSGNEKVIYQMKNLGFRL